MGIGMGHFFAGQGKSDLTWHARPLFWAVNLSARSMAPFSEMQGKPAKTRL
jgi:hypothetical protein